MMPQPQQQQQQQSQAAAPPTQEQPQPQQQQQWSARAPPLPLPLYHPHPHPAAAAAAAAAAVHHHHHHHPHPPPGPRMLQPQHVLPPPMPLPIQMQPLASPNQLQMQMQQQNGDLKTLWVGDLVYWMDEQYLTSCFSHASELQVQSVKVIRNKQSGMSEGYGFVEFATHAMAEKVLQTFNGAPMPSTELPFRLNWACFGIGERRPEQGPDFSIFVGDLAPDVTDYTLQETFHSRYPSVKGAKVVMDTATSRSKGYGFVRFGDEAEKNRAMAEMNGVYCSSRPMRISNATPKKSSAAAGALMPPKVFYQGAVPHVIDNDPSNTTVFVGGLDQSIKDEDLKQVFSQFGDILYVKIPAGKGCGFVQFTTRASAEEALLKLHGSTIGQQTIRLSWGRTPANKQRVATTAPAAAPAWAQIQPDFAHWNAAAYYGYPQGYECYGYAPPPQDPGPYAYHSYPPHAYGAYPQQVS